MAESSQDNPLDNSLSAFGANEWLVDEMYEQYQQDPNSVDKAWWDFFKQYSPKDSTSAPAAANGATQTAPQAAAPKPSEKPAPAAPAAAAQTGTATQPSATAPKSAPASSQAKRADAAPAQPATKTKNPVPKEPEPASKAEVDDEPALTVLRGAPARTVQNMDISLTVPTATSVRSVPVKLLIDNRTVINNHLARARGGKV